MSDRDDLLTTIREALADDPEIDAISLRPALKELLGLDYIDGVVILADMGYDYEISETIH